MFFRALLADLVARLSWRSAQQEFVDDRYTPIARADMAPELQAAIAAALPDIDARGLTPLAAYRRVNSEFEVWTTQDFTTRASIARLRAPRFSGLLSRIVSGQPAPDHELLAEVTTVFTDGTVAVTMPMDPIPMPPFVRPKFLPVGTGIGPLFDSHVRHLADLAITAPVHAVRTPAEYVSEQDDQRRRLAAHAAERGLDGIAEDAGRDR